MYIIFITSLLLYQFKACSTGCQHRDGWREKEREKEIESNRKIEKEREASPFPRIYSAIYFCHSFAK